MFLRWIFCKIASLQNGQNIQVFGCFLRFEEQSRGTGACSRAGYLFISPVCGSDFFGTLNPYTQHENPSMHMTRAASGGVKMQKPLVFAYVELKVKKPMVFARSIQNMQKTIGFLHFFASGRSPSNHRGLGASLIYFSPMFQKW